MAAVKRENDSLQRESAAVNLGRIVICALFAIPLNLTHIVVFWLRSPGSAAESAWRMGIILCHLTMMALMVPIGLTAWKTRRREMGAGAKLLQLAMPVTFLVGGVVITAIDQLVTTNITPYVLVALLVGSMFLTRPHHAAMLFAASFAALYYALGSGPNPEVILSNRSNGVTAMAIGFVLSVAMWRHFAVEIRQRRQIEAQSAELERVNRELQNMAFTDSLTGLPNRRYFDQAMARELAAIERGGPPASVIEFDLDHFKEINDSCGHAAGDEILRQVAGLVNGTIRKADMFARYGGEEFILLLPGTALEGAGEVAEKLRRRIEEHVFLADGHKVNLSASFGVAELSVNPATSFYRSVDHALYRAKQLGRNRVEAAERAVTKEMLPGA
jgi:diguanylate cyclase (GGDEF)-like protein